jgi:polyferredoxin
MIAKVSLLKSHIRKSYVKVLSYSGFIAGVAVVLVLWFGLNNPRSIPPIRTGEFWSSVVLSFAHATPYWLLRTTVVLAIVAGGFIIGNLWCRFVCPTGGLLELIRRVAVFRIYKTDACNDCDRCLNVCEMQTRPDEINCTNCGDCIGSCPVDAIKIGRKRV